MTRTRFAPLTPIKSQEVNDNFDGIIDGSILADNNRVALTRGHYAYNAVITGLTIATSSSLASTIAAGAGYVSDGTYRNYFTTANINKTFTASKDTYVDVDNSGNFYYVEVANGATTGMTLTTNCMRIAKVVTSASAVTSVAQGPVINSLAAVGNWFGGFDPIGNAIYPRPSDNEVGRVARNVTQTTGAPGGSSVPYNGCNNIPVVLEQNRNYVFEFFESVLNGYTGTGDWVIEMYLSNSPGSYTTRIQEFTEALNGGNHGVYFRCPFYSGSYNGNCYLELKLRSTGWSGTTNIISDATRTGIFTVYRG